MKDYSFYRRILPHWQPQDSILFVTSRLEGPLSKSVLEKIAINELRAKTIVHFSLEDNLKIQRETFRLFDKEMDNPQKDYPLWLRDERIASIVKDTLWYWHEKRYQLHRYVIMPNHMHILIEPLLVKADSDILDNNYFPLWKIMQSIKNYTARHANKVLNRKGRFWSLENYDHWIRNEQEYMRVVQYIDNNPVKAGFCNKPNEWILSSVAEI